MKNRTTKQSVLLFSFTMLVFCALSSQNIVASERNLNGMGAFFNTPEDPYLAFAEVMPEPVGGLPAIYKKISYPSVAKAAGLEGKVYLLVMVNENGGVDDVKVIRGIGGGCDEAAESAVKAVKYSPGKNKGVPVKVKLSLSITFKLK